MEKWDTDFYEVSICYNDRMIQIKTDKHLLTYLKKPNNGSVELSQHIHKVYKQIYGKELNISIHSLAIEILIHVYVDVFSRLVEKVGGKLPNDALCQLTEYMEKIQDHTEIIDCGEKEVDPNRFIFDLLEPYHTVIYLIFGTRS